MILPLTKHVGSLAVVLVGSLAVVLVGAHSSGPDQSSGLLGHTVQVLTRAVAFLTDYCCFSIHKSKCQYNIVIKVMIAS
jgi:hypothetical protein